jgi:hypothetical protein
MTEQLNQDQQTIVERLKKSHVHFATPCYGGNIMEGCFSSYLRFSMLAMKHDIPFSIDTMVNESLVCRARNNLVAKFLANPDATHLMFVDADIAWDPENVLRLVLHDKGVVCGAYPMKTEPIRYVLNVMEGAQHHDPLYEVSTSGTGFMLIKREIIESLAKAMPELKYRDSLNLGEKYEPHMYALFDTIIDENGHYLSEDWTFCKRVREVLRKPIWIDTGIKLDHLGTHRFRGDTDNLKNLVEYWKNNNIGSEGQTDSYKKIETKNE